MMELDHTLSPAQLVNHAFERGVLLSVTDGELRFRLTVPEFPFDLKQQILRDKAAVIAYLQNFNEIDNLQIVPRRAETEITPLSFNQQRIWFIDQLFGESQQYNMLSMSDVYGRFDIESASKALQAILERHTVLKSNFVQHDGSPSVVVRARDNFKVHKVQVACRAEAIEFGEALLAKAFSLHDDLLLSATVFHWGDTAHQVLAFKTHHIIFDGLSLLNFVQEFSELYRAICLEQQPALPTLPFQYADYAFWCRQIVAEGKLDKSLSYWAQQLAELPLTHSLPLDFQRTARVDSSMRTVSCELSADQSARVKQLAAQHNMTSFMVLHACLALVLSRFSNSYDIVIGTPVAGRTKELNELIGFFANTVVLRTNTKHSSINEYFAHIKNINVEAQKHQLTPFDLIVERLGVHRSTQYSPVFQIMLSMQPSIITALDLGTCKLNPIPLATASSDFDLDVQIITHDEHWSIHWQYNPQLFMEDSIIRLVQSMQYLLNSIPLDLDAPLSSISVLNADELQKLSSVHGTCHPFEYMQSVVECFELNVKSIPAQTALWFEGRGYSYSELSKRSNELAHALLRRGAGPETVIGVCLNRNVDLVVAVLGIMKSGAAFVSLDPQYPSERLAYIAEDSCLKFVVTSTTLKPLLGLFESSSIIFTDVSYENVMPTVDFDHFNIKPNDLAYIIYTSGSTGQPKGVMIEHRSVAAFASWASRYFSRDVLENVLASTSLNFDLAIFEIFVPLMNGGSVTLVENILSLIEKPQPEITLINTVPSGISALLSRNAIPERVKMINLAGEPLKKVLVNQIFEKNKNITIANLYGPSEDTTYSTVRLYEKPLTEEPTIGRAIEHSQIRILNEDGSLSPFGVPGELYITGAGLARGYQGKPEVTAEKFVMLHDGTESCRSYRTGDYGRYTSNGDIMFLGRADEQIKIRGFRVELGEIESALQSMPQVADCCVLCRDIDLEPVLVAFVVWSSADADESAVRAALNTRLPHYMLPAFYVSLQALPRNRNGKTDKKALLLTELRRDDSVSSALSDSHLPIAEVWSQILSIPMHLLQAESNFFSLGGHSLLAVKLCGMLYEKLQLSCSLRTVFEFPQLADFCRVLAPAQFECLPAIEHRTDHLHRYPLTESQRRLWFIDKLQSSSDEYNMPYVFQVDGELSESLLTQALRFVIVRHQPLASVFIEQDGQIFQRLLDATQFNACVTDVSSIPIDTILELHLLPEARRPFRLDQDFMIRLCYYRRSDQHGILLINLHHIAFDGWSLPVFARELQEAYSALLQQRVVALQPLPVNFFDYTLWQASEQYHSGLALQMQYWKDQLNALPELHQLPLISGRPDIKQHLGRTSSQTFSPANAQALIHFSRQLQLTPFMVLHAVFSLVVARFSAQHDVVVGTPVMNRDRPELAGLIGFFANTVVLRCSTEQPSVSAFLNHVRQQHLDAQRHQAAPFDMVVDQANVRRSTAYTPLFQLLFTLHTDSSDSLSLGDTTLTPMQVSDAMVKFDLEVFAVFDQSGIRISWLYDVALFDDKMIQNMQSCYADVLENLLTLSELGAQATSASVGNDVALPAILASLPLSQLFSGKESVSLLQPAPQALQVGYIHQLFEYQARRNPEFTAINVAGEHFSYGQIEGMANRLSSILLLQGIGPKSRVGLCLERSIWQSVAVLAVLKLGACYVPLAPDIAIERLSYVIADAKLQLLLCNDVSTLWSSLDIQVMNLSALCRSPAWLDHTPIQLPALPEPPAMTEAYVIYTSGSTGKPKGVLQHHATIAHLIAACIQQTSAESLNTLQFTPLTFDVSIQELAFTWATGSCLNVIDAEQKADLNKLAQLITRLQIGRLFVPPAVFHLLTEQWTGIGEMPAYLRQVFVAGEAFRNSQSLQDFLRQAPYVEVWNQYGPTETHVVSGSLVNSQLERTEFTIGKPIENTVFIVIDSFGLPAPAGVSGELFVSGPGVGLGYLGLSDPRFLAQPEHWSGYFTGDLVRQLSSGDFEFLGRRDEQVNLHGYRIELTEIENVLLQLGLFSNVKVLLRGEGESKTLHAYFQFSSVEVDDADAVTAISAHLRRHLPSYMWPRFFYRITDIGLTVNGKTDVKSLVALKPMQGRAEESCQFEGTELSDIRRVWAEALDLPAASIAWDSDFFGQGGTSLLAVKLLSLIRTQLGLEFSLSKFYQDASFSRLSQLITPCVVTEERITAAAINPTNRYPLSYGQQRFISIAGLGNSSGVYNIQLAVDYRGRFSVSVAESVMRKIITAHECLRTSIVYQSEQWFQEVKHEFDFNIRHVTVPASNAAEQLRIIQEDDYVKEFDFEKDIFIRLCCVDVEDSEYCRLFLNMPHIASDGWTMRLIQQDFIEGYNCELSGKTWSPRLSVLQYKDYALWQRHYENTESYKRQLIYWQEQLKDLPATHSLALDYLRPSLKQYSGKQVSSSFDDGQKQKILTLARKFNCSPFMIFHGALALTISRFSYCNDIAIGVPVSGRNRPESSSICGYLSNTLVLRTQIRAQKTDEFFAYVRDVNIQAHANQDVPFDRVVELLNPVRSASYTPLFQILLNFNERIQHSDANPSLFSPVSSDLCNAKFDIDVAINEVDAGYEFIWTYDSSLFTDMTAKQLSNYYMAILDDLVSGKTNEIRLLASDYCKSELELFQYSKFKHVTPQHSNLAEAFLHQVESNPDNFAVIDGSHSLTYKQLAERAVILSVQMRNLYKLKENDRVLIHIHRSVELIIAMLATVMAGATYVPVDENTPQVRFRFILEDSESVLLLTDIDDPQLHFGIPCLNVNDWKTQYDEERLEKIHSSSLPAYIIYTSGTTGQPKGVIQTHMNVLRLFKSSAEHFDFSSSDIWTMFHSIAFDFSVWEIWGALLHGGTLTIPDYVCTRSPAVFINWCSKYKITVLNQTPSAFKQISAQMINDSTILPSLRYVIFGGEAMHADMLNKWFSWSGSLSPRMINMYGITETTVHVTFKEMIPGAENETVGEPLLDQIVYILGTDQLLLPMGARGEIYIGGAGLAVGYNNNDNLTADKFVKDPFIKQHFSGELGNRMYKTGDLGRLNHKGELIYLGRTDSQVQINGYRIEIGEIETVVSNIFFVKNASVYVDEYQGEPRIICFVQCENNDGEFLMAIRKKIADSLPLYMMPHEIVSVDEIPLTVNGKLDVRKIKEKYGVYLKQNTPDVRYLNTEQMLIAERLLAIWKQVLTVEDIDIYANFFSCGGDSIKAVLLAEKAGKQGIACSMRDLYTYQTIADLILNAKSTESLVKPSVVTLQPAVLAAAELKCSEPIESVYPASSMQSLMLSYLDTDTGVYHPQQLLEFDSSQFCIIKFQNVINHLVLKHRALRSHFIEYNSSYYQVVLKRKIVNVDYDDLSGYTEEQCKLFLQLMYECDFERVFVNSLCNFRFRVLCFGNEHYGLFISGNHALEDGWGMTALLNEMLELFDKDKPPEINQTSDSMQELVNLENNALSDQYTINVWSEIMSRFKLIAQQNFPVIRGMPQKITIELSKAESQDIKDVASALRVPAKAMFLFVYMKYLSALVDHSLITVDVITSKRTPLLSDPIHSLGLFWSFFPLIADMDGTDRSVLDELVKQLLLLDTHSLYPVQELKSSSGETYKTPFSFKYVDFHNGKESKSRLIRNVQRTHASDVFEHALSLSVSHDADGIFFIHIDSRYEETAQHSLSMMKENILELINVVKLVGNSYF